MRVRPMAVPITCYFACVCLFAFVCGSIFYIMPFKANTSAMYYAPVCVIHFVLIIASRGRTRGSLDSCVFAGKKAYTLRSPHCHRMAYARWLSGPLLA